MRESNVTKGWEPYMAAVCAAPHDDKPRLIFAAWLQQNGQPERADLIRLGIRLASIPSFRDRQNSPLVMEVIELEGKLQNGAASKRSSPWRGDLPTLKGVRWGGALTERGFFDAAEFDSIKALRAHAAAVFAASPVTTVAVKRMSPKAAEELAGMDWLGRLTMLRLHGPVGADGVRAIAACPRFERLEFLWIENGRIGDDGVAALAASKGLRTLQRLYLKRDKWTIEAAKSLCASKALPNLSQVSGMGMSMWVEVLRHGVSTRFGNRFPYSDWTA